MHKITSTAGSLIEGAVSQRLTEGVVESNSRTCLLFFLGTFVVTLITLLSPHSASAAWQPSLSVGLLEHHTTVSLSANGQTTTITVKNGKLTLNGKTIDASTYTLPTTANSASTVLVNGKTYRGTIRIDLHGGSFTVVNVIPTEDYLADVLPKEMSSSWPQEAQKAQAVAARTFALHNRGRHKDAGYDLCTSTHCQSYGGVTGEEQGSTAAIAATYGEVLTYQGNLIDAVFHTDSGGMTDRSEDVWGSQIPYLRPAKELEMNTQPWKRTFSADTFAAKLARKKDIGKLLRITLSPLTVGKSATDRSASGRVKSATFAGTKGTLRLTGNDLRSLFSLPSTLFDLGLSGSTVTANGYGAGHGLGLSQWGARAFAAKGMKYQDILSHYYAGTTLKQLYKK